MIIVFDEQTDILNLVLFPVQVPTEHPRIVFSIIIMQVGDHTDFVREVPQDLQCLPRIWATCAVVDASTYLDILTLDFLSNLGASSKFYLQMTDETETPMVRALDGRACGQAGLGEGVQGAARSARDHHGE